MSDQSHPSTETLATDECWRLFGTQAKGRICGVIGGRLELFPVNVAALDGKAYLRTAPGTLLSTMVSSPEVLLEVDGVVETDGVAKAWSVVLRGDAEVVSGLDLSATLEDIGPKPWQDGVKDDFVQITPTEVTGRRFPITGN